MARATGATHSTDTNQNFCTDTGTGTNQNLYTGTDIGTGTGTIQNLYTGTGADKGRPLPDFSCARSLNTILQPIIKECTQSAARGNKVISVYPECASKSVLRGDQHHPLRVS